MTLLTDTHRALTRAKIDRHRRGTLAARIALFHARFLYVAARRIGA